MTIREQLVKHNLTRIADGVEATAKPSLLLFSGDESTEACSRLGGEPNLPRELPWPTWKGRPLPFVAQLDLAAIPHDHGLKLPLEGSLFFFYEGGDAAWGFQSEDRGSAQVLYASTPLGRHPQRSIPKEVPNELRFRSVHLKPGSSERTLPDYQDQIIEGFSLSKAEGDDYFKLLEALSAERPSTYHRIGGYPEPIQGDPRLEAELVSHGLYCGDPSGFNQGKELGLYRGATEWELLLQVESDESANMMWGDAGRLYFLIRRQDLETRAFENAWLILQCG